MHDKNTPPREPANDNLSAADHNRLFHLVEEWKTTYLELPYPWCHTPEICKEKGYCPRDPNCGD